MDSQHPESLSSTSSAGFDFFIAIMSAFTTSSATFPDLPSIATVSQAAFKDSPHTMSYWIFPQEDEEGIYNWRLRSIIDYFNNDPSTHLVKCVDIRNNKIVSFALWQKPQLRETEEEKARTIVKKKEKEDMDNELPEGTNKLLMDDFDSATQEMRRKYVDTANDYGEPKSCDERDQNSWRRKD